MAEAPKRVVFVASVDFVSGPALDVPSAPVTTIRIEGDKIAMGTGEQVTRLPAANVKSIALTPMSEAEAIARTRRR